MGRWRLRAESALSLALLRIVVALLMLTAPGFREGAHVAVRARASWVAPEGLAWFVRHVPINGTCATMAQVLVAFAALCAVVGFRPRLCFGVLAVVGFYLFSIAQLAGHVWHDMHLLWFCAILATSPCGDALGLDARRAWWHEGEEYAAPLWTVRLLLGAVYLFPGVHKLATSGVGWASSDNLRHQLYWKWAQHGVLPAFRIDHHAWLLQAAGIGVLVFELSFVFLMLFRRTRPVAALAGLAFHLASQAIFLIPFASLWLCYVALVDPRPLGRYLATGGRPADPIVPLPPASRPLALPSVIVGALLLVGATVQGVRGQTRAYPFAAYPTFDRAPPTDMPDLTMVTVDESGARVEIPHARDASGYRTQRQWAEIWSLAGVTAPVDPARLRAYYARVRPADRSRETGKERVAFYRVYRSVVPEDRGRLTRTPSLLLELDFTD
ncbi:MAG: HTTM domain-containing protein [Pseudomonadota bacterium]